MNRMTRSFICMLAILLCCTTTLWAGVSSVEKRKEGANLASGAVMTLKDVEFDFMKNSFGTYTNTFTNANKINRLILKYTEANKANYSQTWNVTAVCTIRKWDENDVEILPAESATLSIDYNPGSGTRYTDLSSYELTAPGYKTEVTINTVSFNGLTALPSDVELISQIEVERYYQLNILQKLAVKHTYNQVNNTYDFDWDIAQGAEEYDFEWLFIDKYDHQPLLAHSFFNANRVTVSTNTYSVSNVFEDGNVLYRVRPVGRIGAKFNQRQEGEWSVFKASNIIPVSNLDKTKNWQYAAVYAEDGKKKEVLSFFDGSGRSRQAVTRLSTDNVAVIGESIYDYEGRPSINVLPAPTLGRESQLKFYQSFTLNTNGDLYSKKDFHKDITTVCLQETSTPMLNTQGAANYYSPSNPDAAKGFNAALPDAQGYPFSQTIYNQKGEAAAQNAPGIDFAMGYTDAQGKTHESRSFFAHPMPENLDRLFGNNVGDATHYRLDMHKDPNGQLSLSYTDLSGKVIATSLVGEKPVNLEALPSYTFNSTKTIDHSFIPFNHEEEDALVVGINYPVFTAGPQDFVYQMTPQTYSLYCSNPQVDKLCKYDLEITIYDECDNAIIDPISILIDGQTFPVNNFTANFPKPGTYRIFKKLKLNEEGFQQALADFKATLPGTCMKTLQEIRADLENVMDKSECQGCEYSCRQDALKLYPDENSAGFITEFENCKANRCGLSLKDEDESCETIREILADDFEKDGQYISDDNFLAGLNWGNGEWKNADFKDVNGVVITNWADLKSKGIQGYASKLFAADIIRSGVHYSHLYDFHPEACNAKWCDQTYASNAFDAQLTLIQTAAEATTHPYGDLFNNGTSFGTLILNNDPYFTDPQSPGLADNQAMLDKITTNDFWNSAVAIANTDPVCTGSGANVNLCNDLKWRYALGAYLATKSKLMHDRKLLQCPALCDNTTPKDYIADGSGCGSGYNMNYPGKEIRFPDVDVPAVTPGNINDITSQFEAYEMQCNYMNKYTVPRLGAAALNYPNIYIKDDKNSNIAGAINSGICTTNDPEKYAACIVNEINATVSSPIDYTAQLNITNPKEFYIIGDVNYHTYTPLPVISFYVENSTTPAVVSAMPATSTLAEDCGIPSTNCMCQNLVMLEDFYNTISNPTSSLNQYIIDRIYQTVGMTIVDADVDNWRNSCSVSCRKDVTQTNCNLLFTGKLLALTAALKCDDEPCGVEQNERLDMEAQREYDKIFKEKVKEFESRYKATCMGGIPKNLNEQFTAKAIDNEHHFTLYYYDQADNLVMTLPPNAVVPIAPANIHLVADHRANPTGVTFQDPAHNYLLATHYKYNTINSVVEQNSPDGGLTKFWYDRIVRLRFSQNAKQAAATNNCLEPPCADYYGKFSYIKYDAQSRPIESGESDEVYFTPGTISNSQPFYNFVNVQSFPNAVKQVTKTFYDQAQPQFASIGISQDFLRKRIANSTYEEDPDNDPNTYDHATHYSYDVHGNVKTLVQDNPAMGKSLAGVALNQRFKRMDYFYDLISGKVNRVAYQQGQPDQLYHQYFYDADNRITNVYITTATQLNTSAALSTSLWEQDAKYFYYLHGPMARTEVGDKKVQGMDYVYTINGWIKGVNSNLLYPNNDIGKDGLLGSMYLPGKDKIHSNIASDAAGYTLGYFTNDYKSINITANSLVNDVAGIDVIGDNLYNGNIKQMETALLMPNAGALPTTMPLISNHYRYDQLNRLVKSTSYTKPSLFETTYGGLASSGKYDMQLKYDPNGNITEMIRKDQNGNGMDLLTYRYDQLSTTANPLDGKLYNNRLYHVNDAVATAFSPDVKDQGIFNDAHGTINTTNNYGYDEIGNLVRDNAEGIAAIEWNISGKITKIKRKPTMVDGFTTNRDELEFKYDAMGHRILKISKPYGSGNYPQSGWTYTYYVRDASGNVMATYERKLTLAGGQYTEAINMTEQHLYGASRLGVKDETKLMARNKYNATTNTSTGLLSNFTNMSNSQPLTVTAFYDHKAGAKMYECVNHLGNVLATVSDRKLIITQNNITLADNFEAPSANQVIQASPSAGTYAVRLRTPTGQSLPASAFSPALETEVHNGDVIQATVFGIGTGTTAGGVLVVHLKDESGNTITGTYLTDGLQNYSGTGWKQLSKALTVNLSQYPGYATYTGKLYAVTYAFNPSPAYNWFDDLRLNINLATPVVSYKPDVLSATDYYAFGMVMPGRNYSSGNYRYGFNGKENDNEVKGVEGSQQDYGFRIYDPRIAKFLSVDPLTKGYPELTPYQFASNTPIQAIDLDGLEKFAVTVFFNKFGNAPSFNVKYIPTNERLTGSVGVLYNFVNSISKTSSGLFIYKGFIKSDEESKSKAQFAYYLSKDNFLNKTGELKGPLGDDSSPDRYGLVAQGRYVNSPVHTLGYILGDNPTPRLAEFYTTKGQVSGGIIDYDYVISYLLSSPCENLLITGRTDREGSSYDNVELSANRVMEVRNKIIETARKRGLTEDQVNDIDDRLRTRAEGEARAAQKGEPDKSRNASERTTEITEIK